MSYPVLDGEKGWEKQEWRRLGRTRWRAAPYTWCSYAGRRSRREAVFDAQNGLLVNREFERVTPEDGIVQYEMLLGDYREVNGLKLPFTIEQRPPDNTMIFKFAEK